MKKKMIKIRIIFDIDLERMLIWQNFFLKKCIFHSIKLPFDAEVDEKFLNVIYYLIMYKQLV